MESAGLALSFRALLCNAALSGSPYNQRGGGKSANPRIFAERGMLGLAQPLLRVASQSADQRHQFLGRIGKARIIGAPQH